MFKDARGKIKDLLVGKNWSITYITFNPGAIRGNHFHKKTHQIDLIIQGVLLFSNGKRIIKISTPKILWHKPNIPHAYKAQTSAKMISFAFGSRVGKQYESDTYRLDRPLI